LFLFVNLAPRSKKFEIALAIAAAYLGTERLETQISVSLHAHELRLPFLEGEARHAHIRRGRNKFTKINDAHVSALIFAFS
jgi:hypothetical protein